MTPQSWRDFSECRRSPLLDREYRRLFWTSADTPRPQLGRALCVSVAAGDEAAVDDSGNGAGVTPDIDVSFVVPARDAQGTVAATLASLRLAAGRARLSFEMVVADHGSADETPMLAARAGALVVDAAVAKTVGGVRNLGARRARGRVLVFVDADVVLSESWGTYYLVDHHRLVNGQRFVSGNELSCPPNAPWLMRVWFGVSGKETHYIPSGHMLLSAEEFWRLGGFSEVLTAGEDYDLCRRAQRAGTPTARNVKLCAYHFGYPRSVGAFFRRELWHGLGDAQTLPRGSCSRTGWIAAGLLCGALCAALGSGFSRQVEWLGIPIALFLLAAFAAALRRPKRHVLHLFPVALLYGVYLLARICAIPLAAVHSLGVHLRQANARGSSREVTAPSKVTNVGPDRPRE